MFLLDTNHCSRLIDRDPRILQKLVRTGPVQVSISVIVRGELGFMVQHSKRREENASKVSAFLQGIKIHPVDNEIADIYGVLKERVISRFGPRATRKREEITLERLGFKENDIWIAATALRHGLTVVTADGDFTRPNEATPGLQLENWLVQATL